MSAVDAEAELSVFDEVVAERDAARADAYEKVQALAAVSGILLGNDVPSTWDHYGAVADARECARERDEAVLLASANFEALRAQASAATQEVARLTKLTEHMATELNVAWESSRKHEAERDEARALNHRGLMKLVENERLRDALEEIAGMCSENAEQMQAIAQDALGSMPPSDLPYICPKSVAVAEDLTPGEITYVEVKPDMAELRMALREACGDAPLLEGALDELAAYRAYVPSLPDLVAAATKGATR